MVVEGILLVSRGRVACLECGAKVDVLASAYENGSVTKSVAELMPGDIVVGLGRIDIVAPVLIATAVKEGNA